MSASVQPIPEGVQSIVPYLIIDGASKAVEFYKEAFNAEVIGCFEVPDGSKVMHAEIQIGDSRVYLADAFPEWGCQGPQALGGTSVSLHLWTKDVDQAFERAVAAGCEVTMPLADQFWGDRMGKLRDPFGHEWNLSMHVEDVSSEEMQRRVVEMFSQENG